MYANVKVKVLLKIPLSESSETKTQILRWVKVDSMNSDVLDFCSSSKVMIASTETGVKVPKTVIKRQIFRPTTSEILPNRGQDKKDKIPRIHSVKPEYNEFRHL